MPEIRIDYALAATVAIAALMWIAGVMAGRDLASGDEDNRWEWFCPQCAREGKETRMYEHGAYMFCPKHGRHGDRR